MMACRSWNGSEKLSYIILSLFYSISRQLNCRTRAFEEMKKRQSAAARMNDNCFITRLRRIVESLQILQFRADKMNFTAHKNLYLRDSCLAGPQMSLHREAQLTISMLSLTCHLGTERYCLIADCRYEPGYVQRSHIRSFSPIRQLWENVHYHSR